MRCGCPADTSAKQKHRPSRQARPPSGVRQSVFPHFSSLRSRVNGCGNPFSLLRELRILSRSALRMTNRLVIAKPCKRLWQSVLSPSRHCGAGVRWTPLRSRSTDRAGRRDHRKVRGNPFSLLRELRILSRSALRMTNRLVIAKPCKQLWQSAPPPSSSLRCGCPADTSAKQKHRPIRQARPP